MARVPMVPEARVRQSASPLNPNPPPGAFGAVGDSLAVLGKAAGGVSDAFAERAEKVAAIDNRVESDAAALRVSQRQNEFLVKYKTENQGTRAKPNLPDAFRELEAIRNEEGANLLSPAARDMFNSQTRIGTAQATGNLSAFAASEWLRTTNDSIDAQVNNAQREMSAANFGLGVAAITNQAALKAEVNGWTEAQAKDYIAKNVGDAAWSITSNIAPVDPNAAQEFFEANKQWMTPQQQGDVTAKIRSSRENMMVAEVAQSTLATVMGGTVARREAIAGIESAGSGDYTAVGKRTRTGDRAYGRYQVMGANIPKWTKQVLGKAMTPQEFLANPAAQDKVFDAVFGSYVERYGSEAEAASVWFTGRPMAQGAAMADVNGMTGAEYVRKFTQNIGEGGVDRAEAQALAGYNAIGEQISDPRLRDRAQTEFLARLGQQRQIDALRTGEARERLQGAINAGVTSVAALQKAYPGALEDWNTVGSRGQQQVQNAMLASASQVTPERHVKYLELLGFAGSSPAKFSQLDLSAYNITPSQHTELFKKQQGIIKAKEKETWQNVTLGKVLGNELVKSAIVRAGIEKDTPEWYQFNGALLGEIAAWGEANPGKKPTDKDYQAMAAGVLANSDRAMVTRFFGKEIKRQPIRRFQTPEYTEGTRPDDPNMAQLFDVFSKREGRAPTPEEMSYMVYRSR